MSRIAIDPVDLDRTFIPIRPDEPITSEIIEGLWSRYRGTLTWEDLLERPRVVILAEANSGKTFEFERQVQRLRVQNKSAFFAAIEQLAEKSLEAVLSQDDWRLFETWQTSGQPGWFFLDSVDEAKLTHRNLELAFRQFAKDLGGGYQRAHIFVSCRGTDWAGESDLKRISTSLPAVPPAARAGRADDALLRRLSRDSKASETPEPPPPSYSIVSLTAFNAGQRRQFLERGVHLADVAGFEEALSRQGLVELANRPGDLLVLAAHWASKRRLGGLTEMMEVAIAASLADRRERADANLITDRQAREGAERLAAAMVMCRRVTVKLDPLAGGAGVSLGALLDDWKPAEQDALIRRGVFAAASFGEARFTNRTIMEYLAAQWFKRARARGCPDSRILAALTAKPFGVDTVPPSLRAAAAWIAPHCAALRRFIIKNAPLTLIHHGDPAVLAVADRSVLLHRYAELHRAGRIRHEYADEHLLWMFADPALAPTIKAVWPEADDNLRFELLRLIEQGSLVACGKLASEAALDDNCGDYTRILAARVLMKFGLAVPLQRLAKKMLAMPDAFSARTGPQLAAVLFPKTLNLKQLLVLMDKSPRARSYQVEGFGYVLEALYAACPSPAAKRDFITGVAALCRQPPLKTSHEPISQRHAPIARRVQELLVAALKDVPSLGVWPGLVELAWVAQVSDSDTGREPVTLILDGIRRYVTLNESLFWFGLDRMAEIEPALDPVRLWRWQRLERRFWTIREEDRPWLEAAIASQNSVRRRVAFEALITLVEAAPQAAEAFEDLRRRYGSDPQLMGDLDLYLRPRVEPPEMVEYAARQAAREAEMAEAEALNHRAWRELRDEVAADPDRLKDERLFHKWPDFRPLVSLTNWLALGAERDKLKAVLTFSDLSAAFSPEVAEAYREGMLRFWRAAKPRPPTLKPDGTRTTPWSTVLAMAGLALDAGTTPSWTDTLDLDDARRAVQHAFVSGMDFPDWLDALLIAFPHVVEPYVVRQMKREWAMDRPSFTPLLYRAGATLPITPRIQAALLKLIEAGPPVGPEWLDEMRKILRRLTLTPVKRRTLARMIEARLQACQSTGDWDGAMSLMPVLFVLDSAGAATTLASLLAAQSSEKLTERSEAAVGTLFGMSRGKVWGLRDYPEDVLAALLRLTYRYVRPEDDARHDGSYSPDRRDDAETARNELLGALVDKPGERAYLLMRQLLAEDAFGVSTSSLHRLGQEMAERASEGRAWDEAAVLRFELDFVEPITSGERLFALVCELIEDIDRMIQGEDVSPRELLLAAPDEHAVQSWVAHELRSLSRDRFAVVIENEAPGRNRLDITVISPAAAAEVAVEMKHGGMDWTVPKLKASLSGQLAKRYLKAANRRHGVFVVSNHRPRRWDNGDGGRIGFNELIEQLQTEAEGLTANRFGPIHVAVRGVNAVLPEDELRNAPSKRRPATPGPAKAKRSPGAQKGRR